MDIKKNVEGIEDLQSMVKTVAEASDKFESIQAVLGSFVFTSGQQMWIATISRGQKLLQDMSEKKHLENDEEFSSLLELMDANQSNKIEAERSVALRKVRTTLHKMFIKNEDLPDMYSIIKTLADLEIEDQDVEFLITVNESLEVIAKKYSEAAGDTLEKDKRLLEGSIQRGFFEFENPPLSSGLKIAELVRRCFKLCILAESEGDHDLDVEIEDVEKKEETQDIKDKVYEEDMKRYQQLKDQYDKDEADWRDMKDAYDEAVKRREEAIAEGKEEVPPLPSPLKERPKPPIKPERHEEKYEDDGKESGDRRKLVKRKKFT